MMRIIYYLGAISLLFATIFSLNTCGDQREIVKRTKDGRDFEFEIVDGKIVESREFDSVGNLLAIHLADNENLTFRDSSVYYSSADKTIYAVRYYNDDGILHYEKQYAPDGRLTGEGKLTNNEYPIGIWTYFYPDGKRREQADYIAFGDSTFLNNAYAFDRNGKDTVLGYSKFYDLAFSDDTIPLGRTVTVKAVLRAPKFKDESSKVMALTPDYFEPENLTANFDNYNDVVLDTTVNINQHTDYRRQLNINTYHKSFDRVVVFGKRFRKTGRQNFRGALVEYVKVDTLPNGHMTYKASRTYFDKEVYVTDSVQ